MSGNVPTNTDNAAFNNAADVEAKKFTDLNQDELLEFYGLYKIGTGHDITQSAAPSMFDFTAKKKRSGWQKQIDDGYSTPEKAQARYIERVEQLKQAKNIV